MLIYVPDGNETDHCHYHSEFTKAWSCGIHLRKVGDIYPWHEFENYFDIKAASPGNPWVQSYFYSTHLPINNGHKGSSCPHGGYEHTLPEMRQEEGTTNGGDEDSDDEGVAPPFAVVWFLDECDHVSENNPQSSLLNTCFHVAPLFFLSSMTCTIGLVIRSVINHYLIYIAAIVMVLHGSDFLYSLSISDKKWPIGWIGFV